MIFVYPHRIADDVVCTKAGEKYVFEKDVDQGTIKIIRMTWVTLKLTQIKPRDICSGTYGITHTQYSKSLIELLIGISISRRFLETARNIGFENHKVNKRKPLMLNSTKAGISGPGEIMIEIFSIGITWFTSMSLSFLLAATMIPRKKLDSWWWQPRIAEIHRVISQEWQAESDSLRWFDIWHLKFMIWHLGAYWNYSHKR